MSIEILLVPFGIALTALNNVVREKTGVDVKGYLEGKVKYECYTTSMDEEKELIIAVKKAGYEIKKDDLGYNTTINTAKAPVNITWRLANGAWIAHLKSEDHGADMDSIMKKIEEAAGCRTSIDDSLKNIPVIPHQSLQTCYRDQELLTKALKDYELTPQTDSNGAISCNINGMTVLFEKDAAGCYCACISNFFDIKKLNEHLANIDDYYKNNLQSSTYENMKTKLLENNMSIENEEVLEDNSILITLNIQE